MNPLIVWNLAWGRPRLCSICNQKLPSELALADHKWLAHHISSCDVCGMVFADLGELARHALYEAERHMCSRCGLPFYCPAAPHCTHQEIAALCGRCFE